MNKAILTIGQLRGLTAVPRATDRVKVLVYLPNTRGPVECYIAGHLLAAPDAESDNLLTLQIRPVARDEPELHSESSPLPQVDTADRGTAGRKSESVPNQGGEP